MKNIHGGILVLPKLDTSSHVNQEAEHQRLKDAVVEAAKAWLAGQIKGDVWREQCFEHEGTLWDAVESLNEYESTNAQTQPKHPH